MKKYFFLATVLIIMSVMTACMGKKTNLILQDVTGIRYQDLQVHEKNFQEVTKLISQIEFQTIKYKVKEDQKILLTTEDNIYYFTIGNDYRMKYTINDKTYYSRDEKNIQKLLDDLKGLSGKYESQAYYHAKIDGEYKSQEDDTYIKVDQEGKVSAQIVIEAKEDIYELKVHQIEYDKETETYQDMNLVDYKEKVEKGTKVVIKCNTDLIPLWRVEIQNQYGYKTTFLPYFDEEKQEVVMKREM